jgi:hypothetical protein
VFLLLMLLRILGIQRTNTNFSRKKILVDLHKKVLRYWFINVTKHPELTPNTLFYKLVGDDDMFLPLVSILLINGKKVITTHEPRNLYYLVCLQGSHEISKAFAQLMGLPL